MQKLWQNESLTDQTDGFFRVTFLYFLSLIVVFLSQNSSSLIINSVKTLRRKFHKSCQFCIKFVVVLYDALYYVIWFDAVTMAIAGRKAENSSR